MFPSTLVPNVSLRLKITEWKAQQKQKAISYCLTCKSHKEEEIVYNMRGITLAATTITKSSSRRNINAPLDDSIANFLLPPAIFAAEASDNDNDTNSQPFSLNDSLANFLLPPGIFNTNKDDGDSISSRSSRRSSTSSMSSSSSRGADMNTTALTNYLNLKSSEHTSAMKSLYDSNHSLLSFISNSKSASGSSFGDSSSVTSFVIPPVRKSEGAKSA